MNIEAIGCKGNAYLERLSFSCEKVTGKSNDKELSCCLLTANIVYRINGESVQLSKFRKALTERVGKEATKQLLHIFDEETITSRVVSFKA